MGQMLGRAAGCRAAGFGLLEERLCTAELSSLGHRCDSLLYSVAKVIHSSKKSYFWYLFLKTTCRHSANNSTTSGEWRLSQRWEGKEEFGL